MTDEPWVLAIDFGTSFTVAAARSLRAGHGVVEVIEVDGERRTPSVVVAEADGSLVAGRAAEDLAPESPGRVVREPKSRLGDPAPVVLGGRPHPIGVVVAGLLGHVYAEALRWAGGRAPTEVRLTHPATWGGPRRQLLLDAALLADLPDPVLVPEPVAAAIAYADEVPVPEGSHVLVYDLGGGTFDTAALRATTHGFVLVGRPTGDPRLGGELFDELLANHLGEQLDPAVWEALQLGDDEAWQHAGAALRREARRVKEALSSVPVTFATVALPTGLQRIEVRRDELEAIVAPYVAESVDLLRATADAAGIAPGSLAAISLVGGASRMPIVERLVAESFPDVHRSRRGDPKAVVAIGATHPMATPTRLAQHTSLDRVSEIVPAPTVAEPALPPPTVAGSVAGTTVESTPGTLVERPPASRPAASARRRVAAAVAAGVIAVGGITAIALQGRGDGDETAPTVPSSTASGANGDGPGPVVDLSTTTTTPSTAPTTVGPVTTAAPTTTAPAMSQAAVDAALLTPAEIGADFVAQPTLPDGPDFGCAGSGSGIPTTYSAATNAARGIGQPSQLSIGHEVFAYADATNAVADYQAFVGQLDSCNGTTQDIAGMSYQLEILQEAADPGTLPSNCPDLRLVTVHFISTNPAVPDLWQTNAVFRCGSNGAVISLAALDATSVLDQALIGHISTRAAQKLLQLDGSFDT